ncbi:MAG: hypothetical protein EOP83_10155 [Verrucomicrobiaceae bacterium]|nr:MAG: hypothetical protein EOP83_10155 [Verrucomicrobiaceae bacterium]
MKIFGYQKSGEPLQEMEEISIKCDLKDLDEVIDFLISVRSLMKDHGLNFGHEHLSDWRKKNGAAICGDVDIIISR